MNRIEWEPLDAAVAACAGGIVTIHEGTRTVEVARNVHDMRWLADGPMITIEERGYVRWRRDSKVVDEVFRSPDRGAHLSDAVIAADGTRFVAFDTEERWTGIKISVESPKQGILFRPRLDGVDSRSRWSVTISGNGARIAIGYDTTQPGRGFAVIDIEDDKILDRSWAAQPIERTATCELALDHAGKRLAMAVPEVDVPALGVIRVGTGEVYPRRMIGGASAVALEFRGDLVAYAFHVPPPGARGRLRFDYLAPGAKGDVLVDVLDTQTLEVELPDVVAMAFSRDRRRLACLASTGAIEIVPVP